MRQSLISLLQCALVSPEDHFRTLWNRVDAALCEPPVVDRQGLFAESKIYLKTEGYAMIYMPLSKYHINISPKLMCSDSTILAPYALLKDELSFYEDRLGLAKKLQNVEAEIEELRIMSDKSELPPAVYDKIAHLTSIIKQ
jgi:hypothetical protein